MTIRKECPKCNSKNLSNGQSDFLIVEGREEAFQFCMNCHEEWFVLDKKGEAE